MAIRSTRLVASLVPLLALGPAAPLASSSLAFIGHVTQPGSLVCLSTQRGNGQNLHCRCCGWDEYGHCNHQCCDDPPSP
jgi:hypothetical protein